jgi:hypothetical protein
MGLFDQSQGLMGLGQQPQGIPRESFFTGPNAGQVPQGYQMVNGEFVPNGQPQVSMPQMPQGAMPPMGQQLTGEYSYRPDPTNWRPIGPDINYNDKFNYGNEISATNPNAIQGSLGNPQNAQQTNFMGQQPQQQQGGLNPGGMPVGFQDPNWRPNQVDPSYYQTGLPQNNMSPMSQMPPNSLGNPLNAAQQSFASPTNPFQQMGNPNGSGIISGPSLVGKTYREFDVPGLTDANIEQARQGGQAQQPVNTQTVQPNFMGQTPFGQPQTGQFTSTNPFVQAAQANAQGNIAGALQATAANRINQQTPYGSLSYQQTGTDAQGNPIWSANQNLSPELQQLTQSSLAGLQASQANPMYGINPGDTYSNAIMQRLAPQQRQQAEALDAQLANQGIMPGSEAYNRAKVLQGQTQNDALTSAIVGGMQTGLQAQGLQNTTAANIRNLATPGYVTPYNQATVAGPDYLSAYTSQNATDIARANAEAAQRSSLLGGLAGLGSSAILGGTGQNSALGGLYNLGSKGLDAIGGSGLWNSLFGTGPAITGDTNFLNSIGLGGSTYGSGIEGMATDPLAGLYTNTMTDAENLDYINNLFDWGM